MMVFCSGSNSLRKFSASRIVVQRSSNSVGLPLMIGKVETKVSGLALAITELYAAQVGTSICESVHNVFSKVDTASCVLNMLTWVTSI